MRVVLWLALALLAAIVQAQPPAPVSFAIVGDAPYSGLEEIIFRQMLEEINQEDLAFVVHVGDFKSGGSPCSDELYEQRKRMFQASRHPFILLPGDNDWTDCHRKAAGGYDPLERLAQLRSVFYPDANSLGRRTLKLERQSDDPGTAAGFLAYRENVRWAVNRVLFIGLNVPGSNDNFGRTPQMDAEHEQRGRANAAWLAQCFELARQRAYAAVFVVFQANPDFDLSYLRRVNRADGYAGLKRALLAQTLAFGKPVVLVHGDTHRFRVDHPLYDPATLKRVEQFTRIESFGSPLVDWIKVSVDPAGPKLLSIRIGKETHPAQ
ncbi:MAG: hypothetical protein D4R74_01730 [Betaproteobacteria bacterium]|nr:MAG: hypothetical protein D4R74_01730 [Betaproteobacteria bacterium]